MNTSNEDQWTKARDRVASADLDELVDLWRRARRRWPDISRVPAGAFIDYVLDRAAPAGPLDPDWRKRHHGDLYLVCAFGRGDPRALAAIEQQLEVATARRLSRLGAVARADEVAQRLRARLLVDLPPRRARVESYSGRGSLYRWLAASAAREALTLFREEARRPWRDGRAPTMPTPGDDPETALIKKRTAIALQAAFADALLDLTADKRALLGHYYFDSASIDRLADLFGTHRSTAARRIGRIHRELFEGTRRRLSRRGTLTGSELREMFAEVEDQLSITADSFRERSA